MTRAAATGPNRSFKMDLPARSSVPGPAADRPVDRDILFRGLKAPLRLTDADPVLRLLPEVAPGWPHEVRPADPALRPFYAIRGEVEASRFLCENLIELASPRSMDAVNAACDAMAALAMALPAEDGSVICLHAAGVAMAGRLVVFPNIRRAGKSTLSAALARAGHRVFSDDVVPLSFPAVGPPLARSMGVAPRLRLPLPKTADAGFHDWVAAVAGPRNRQYAYLRLPDQPAEGETLPLGAFVILDRQEGPGPARLEAVAADQAMDVLLHQNFTRDRHSGDILDVMAVALAGVPVFRLSYSGLEAAVDCLEAAFRAWPAGTPSGPVARFRLAEFETTLPDVGEVVRQRAGGVAREIGGTLYLADPEGRGIHRMDALAAAIWELLEEPLGRQELVAVLEESFPNIAAERLAGDLAGLLARLAEAGLVGPG